MTASNRSGFAYQYLNAVKGKAISAVATASTIGLLSVSLPAQAGFIDSLFGSSAPASSPVTTPVKPATPTVPVVNPANAVATSTSMLSNITDGVVGQLSSQLGVSKAQAMGGLGVLMGYAVNKLPAQYTSQIQQLFPGMAAASGTGMMSSLLGQTNSMTKVNTAFQGMGMEPSMVSSFTPVIESYVANSGAGQLATAMGSIW